MFADLEASQQQSAEVLQLMPGLHISTDGSFYYIGVRGLGRHNDFNSRLLFLIDGVRANDNIGDAMLIGTDAMIDVESIDRVEFTPGPGSALYGNNAFFGVLNIVTQGASRLHGVALSMQLAEIGVMLLMFGVGLHFSLDDLLAVRKIALPGAVLQIAAATARIPSRSRSAM